MGTQRILEAGCASPVAWLQVVDFFISIFRLSLGASVGTGREGGMICP